MPTTAAQLSGKSAALEQQVRTGRVGLKRWLGPDYRLGFLFVLPIVVLVLAARLAAASLPRQGRGPV